ncbi:MAG: spore coat protein CotH [Ruminococcaceae bacterium]|nr:spore coat protein CotH [Oscillospiraceae bacterium]
MITSKHIGRIASFALVLALVITLFLINGAFFGITATPDSPAYAKKLFDTSRVHTIDIQMADWDGFLSTCQSEEYTACQAVIDGEAFSGVGLRGKGNTSLSSVASMDSDRYSFKLEFDQYDSARSYYGLDKLSLNNLIQDNTMMKDYLTYRMMAEFGVAAPLTSFVYLTVNGEDWGLYLAVEAVEESFLERNYGTDYGDLYKPDSSEMGGGRGNGREFDMAAAMNEETTTPGAISDTQRQNGDRRPGGGGMGSAETRLQYIDDNPESYSTIFESAKTNLSDADQARLIAALKALSEGDPDAVSAEEVLRYFVVHNYVVNGDSYTGNMVHNYYLYEKDGKLAMIPWDYNLAFGTFQGNSAAQAVNDSIDAPLSVTGNGDRPMMDWILQGEEARNRYHTLFAAFLDQVDPLAIIAQAETLITPYVEQDPTKFCTTEDFEAGVEALKTFCTLRTESIFRQFAGNDTPVDTTGLTLSDMGTMNHGTMGGGMTRPETEMTLPQGDAPLPEGETPALPEGMTPPEGNMSFPDGTTTQPNGQMSSFGGGLARPDRGGMGQNAEPPSGMGSPQMPQGNTGFPSEVVPSTPGESSLPAGLILTGLVLLLGLLFAFTFKRRRIPR